MQNTGKVLGGVGNAIGAAIGLAEGGPVPTISMQGPQSSFGQFLNGVNSAPQQKAGGGLVDVVVSPDEKIVSPEKVEQAAGGKVQAKTVPGKAKVAGDSLKNDTVPTKLPAGSIVIPRSKAGNEKDAAAFVRSVLAKRGRK